MTKMINYISILNIIFALGCKEPPVDPPIPHDITKTNLSVVWYKVFYSDSTLAYFHDPYLSNDYVVFCSDMLINGGNNQIGIGVYNKYNGEKHLLWDSDPGSIVDMGSISDWIITGQNNNLAVFCRGNVIKCYDINTGNLKWQNDNDFLPRINDFGNSLFCANSASNHSKADLYRIELETGIRETIYTIYTNNGYEPSFESFTGWVAPWGDSILVFQNRQYNFAVGDGKVDLYAYNLVADSILWVIDDITTDGNSSVRKPNIVNNRFFFQGMKSQHCIDLVTGEIIWEHQYQNAGFAMVENLYAEGKLFARSGDDVLAYDATTGNLLWRIDNTYGLQTGGRMGYYQGNLYFTGIDEKDFMQRQPYVFCLNAIDGSLVWKGNLVADGALVQNWKDGIIIDQNTGYLYATDTKGIVCIDLNSTPLDTNK